MCDLLGQKVIYATFDWVSIWHWINGTQTKGADGLKNYERKLQKENIGLSSKK
jgi:hypothetical protein